MKSNSYLAATLRWCRFGVAGSCLVLAMGCAALRPETPAGSIGFYSLNAPRRMIATNPTGDRTPSSTAPTLLVTVPRALAGFDSKRLIYVRQPHKIEHFANSEWVDTPARMLSILLVHSLESRADFRAIVHQPGSASGDLRLDTEIVLLQQEFFGVPSQVRFALRATLVAEVNRQVVATREFETVVNATSDDPYGGVVAANQAVDEVLEKLAGFCSEGLKIWHRGAR